MQTLQLESFFPFTKIFEKGESNKKLPIEIRAETRDKMLNKLLSTEGKLVSWRKPLPQNINENVNTSMKKE